MSDYIKRDGVMMVLGQSKTLTDGMRSVLMIPRADVVEVVRCKDCKKRNTRTCMMNNNVGMNKDLFDDDYCSSGEKKDE